MFDSRDHIIVLGHITTMHQSCLEMYLAPSWNGLTLSLLSEDSEVTDI
jgi:hypothetical protein